MLKLKVLSRLVMTGVRNKLSKISIIMFFTTIVISISVSKALYDLNTDNTDEISYGVSLINANTIWDQTIGSAEIIVAVLDTGIDIAHPDLQGNIWENTDEIPDNNQDDDLNGYIDDVQGWDFVHQTPDGGFGPFDYSFADHGTHVAGIIAAELNDFGIAGVAPNVTIMSLRVVNNTGYNPDIFVAEAIRYAADNGAHIISMSIVIVPEEITNTTSIKLVEEALQYAYDNGVLIVSSAGNSGTEFIRLPANHSAVISVGAVDENKILASFSSFGPDLEVVAPGVKIKSTLPSNQFGFKNGTSMAAPHVAGALALMLSHQPALTNSEAREILQQTTEDLGSSGWDFLYGYGLINVENAINEINDRFGSKKSPVISAIDPFFFLVALLPVALVIKYARKK